MAISRDSSGRALSWGSPGQRPERLTFRGQPIARKASSHPLVGGVAEIVEQAAAAFGAQRLADVATMQDQPMMGMAAEFRRHRLLQSHLDCEHGLARRD